MKHLSGAVKKSIPALIPMKLGIVHAFIVKGEKAVIVDTGYAGNAEKILQYLEKHSISAGDVSLILLTHGHNDHYGSADELKEKTGAPIGVHKKDAEYLKKGIDYIGTPACFSGSILKSLFLRTDEHASEPLEVDIAFEGDADLQEFGIDGRLMHTPGHTEGSLTLFLSGGEALVGDLIMGGMIFKKTPHYPLFVSHISKWKESISKVIQQSPNVIYPSHGGPFTYNSVQQFLRQIDNKP
jgi:glyoxylase-like metal-dependent hydrolase (beta-lactamase superfamily II)